MEIIIACDHGGLKHKNIIKDYLLKNNDYHITDVGTFSFDPCDYPEIAEKAYETFLKTSDSNKYIILICKTGEGIAMAANRYKNIRCGIGYNDTVVSLIRKHNNANAIAFGSDFMTAQECIKRINIFLNTNFEGGRHLTRVNMLNKYGS